MGALNRGCLAAHGRVIGVIHERMVDGAIVEMSEAEGFELQVATGETLQERKQLLSDPAQGFIALPGGPGTWDELWEVACMEALGLLAVSRPVVLVNTENYYEGFAIQLERAHKDGILHNHPDSFMKIASSPQEAMLC